MTQPVSRRVLLATTVSGGLLALCGCGGRASTSYQPYYGLAGRYRVSRIDIAVPRELRVSESEKSLMPDADIVWKGDPPGDRYAQIEAILRDGAERGVQALHGSTPAVLRITLRRFHALNNAARYFAPDGAGVYTIRFDAGLFLARSGTPILPMQRIDADFPARTSTGAQEEDEQGISQRSLIEEQIARTLAGWLGTGPDNRNSFFRLGG